MKFSPTSALARYLFPLAAVALTAVLNWGLLQFTGAFSPFALFLLPVVFSALVCGFESGLLAAVAAAGVINMMFGPPPSPFGTSSLAMGSILVFLVESAVLSAACAFVASVRRKYGWFGKRNRAEKSVTESEKRFRMMADNMPTPFRCSDPQGQCIFLNKAWIAFTGRSLQEEKGFGWSEGVHPDDLRHCLDVYLTSLTHMTSFQMEYRLRAADGSYRWIKDSGVPRFDSAGKFEGFVGCCFDVTEQKQLRESLRSTEERIEVLAEQSGLGVFVANAAGYVQEASGMLLEVFNCGERQILGRPWRELFASQIPLPLAFSGAPHALLPVGTVLIGSSFVSSSESDDFKLELSIRNLSDGSLQGVVRKKSNSEDASSHPMLNSSLPPSHKTAAVHAVKKGSHG